MLLGIHTNISGIFGKDKNIESAIVRDNETFNINACQIFVISPHAYNIPKKQDDTKTPSGINTKAVAKVCKEIEISVHSAYTTVGIWKVGKDNMKTAESKKRLGFFEYQMKLTKEITGSCLVVHLTKLFPDEIVDTMEIIKKIAKKHKVRIGLEMTAVKSDAEKTYETPEKLDNIINLLGPTQNYYGIIVDTAHLWGAGEDIASYENMKNWLDRLTFKKKVIMFHLNGSYSERGSGKDKHAIPFNHDDLIFSKFKPENSGVRAVVEFAKKYKIPVILEINRGTFEEAAKTIEIIKKM